MSQALSGKQASAKKQQNAAKESQANSRDRYERLGLKRKDLSIDKRTYELIDEIAVHFGFDVEREKEKRKRHSVIIFYAVRMLAFNLSITNKFIPASDKADLQRYFLGAIFNKLTRGLNGKNGADDKILEVCDLLNESRFISVSDIFEGRDGCWTLPLLKKARKMDGKTKRRVMHSEHVK